jgi:toxin ParE1/3/4
MASAARAPEAEQDIDEIAYLIGSDNYTAMVRWLAELKRAFQLLAEFPGLGPARPELRPDLRSFPIGSYLIFYRAVADGIEVVRVLHGARDLPELFP